MADVISGLNDEQKKAVLKKDGPLLILAGAGSGKTRVITHRIANLILNEGVSPYEICAVTFTNKAAEEMRERVRTLIPSHWEKVTLRIFHSLCLMILRSNISYFGFKNLTIYDSQLQESLLKEVIKELRLDPKQFKPSAVANSINQSKDSFTLPEKFREDAKGNFFGENISRIYDLYEERKVKQNAFDFGDLVLKTVLLFQKEESVLLRYRSRWKYLMVDEYQDTNAIQYRLTKLLTGENRNLCVVGDDDQSIYSWRGADIRNILDFEKDFPETLTVKLEENYRSTKNIINAASCIIKNNSERKDKTIFTNNPEGDLIALKVFENENEEAQGTINSIKRMYRDKSLFKRFVIFYRTNSQSRYFEEALRRENIPYKIFGGFRFYDRAEIKDLIAYLSVIVNPLDSTSLLRIINTPSRGIGDTTVEKLRNFSLSEGISAFEAMNKNIPDIKRGTLSKLQELYKLISSLIEDNEKKVKPSEIAIRVIEEAGFREDFEMEASMESRSRLENQEEFVNALGDFETTADNPELEEYLNNISLLTSEEDSKELTDFVTLMTVHNSKGLEFDIVFLTGMEEGTFPHFMSSADTSEVEEERRLCYVAITRAREKLFISYSSYTRRFGVGENRLPSRFLEEMPEESFESNKDFYPRTERYPVSAPFANHRKENVSLDSQQRTIPKPELAGIRNGSNVKHRDYGVGRVIEMTGSGDNLKVKVKFGNVQKNFLLAYTPLELVK